MLVYNLYALFKAIINQIKQILMWGEAFHDTAMTLQWVWRCLAAAYCLHHWTWWGQGRTASTAWWEALFLSLANFSKSECRPAHKEHWNLASKRRGRTGGQQELVQYEVKCPIPSGCWQGGSSAEGMELGCTLLWFGEEVMPALGWQLNGLPLLSLHLGGFNGTSKKGTFLLGLFRWAGRVRVWSPGLWNAWHFIAPQL